MSCVGRNLLLIPPPVNLTKFMKVEQRVWNFYWIAEGVTDFWQVVAKIHEDAVVGLLLL
jgi:hypothetical protein